MESSFSNSDERDLQQLQERMTKTRKDCSIYFELIKKHLKYLLTIRWNGWGAEAGFNRAIQRYFGEKRNNFNLSYNIDNLQRQIEKEYLHEGESRKHFTVLRTQYETFFASKQVRVIKEIEKWLNESKMQTQEGMVSEGISLDAGLDSECTRLIEEILNLKSQDCQKEKFFHKENEKYADYVQPLLNRKNELEKTNQDFLKQLNDLNNKLLKARQTAQTFHMLLLKEDNVNTGKKSLSFENQNDVDNLFILNKAKELTTSLYNTDEMGKDLLSNHKIISEEELKCEAEKRLKVKQRKSSLLYHGFGYDETQFEEPPKVPLKRREVNLKKHLEQAQLVNYDPKL
ncbi:hypothetical protein Tco_1141629 [Tanacetum coccineum]